MSNRYFLQQTPFENWILRVSDDRDSVKLTYLGKEKSLIADVVVDGVHTRNYSFYGGTVLLPVVGHPTKRVINEVRIRKAINGDTTKFHTLCLARETPKFLKMRYGFTHKKGYVVIDRNTFLRKPVEDRYNSESPFSSVDSGTEMEGVEGVLEMLGRYRSDAFQILQTNSNDTQTVLSKGILITQFIWSLYNKNNTGPSDKINSGMSTLQILKAIQDEGGTLQCTGTRDLLLRIACLSRAGLEIRKVDVYRYYPFIKNIVVNGHSVLEVKTEQGWFLLDPFVRVIFVDTNSRLLTAVDIKNYHENKSLDQIRPIHLETKHEKRLDFDKKAKPFDPYNSNYYAYFYSLLYTELN